MITALFAILMVIVFGKLAIFALKATWGITKIVLTLIFFPAILIILALSGFMAIAFPVLIIAGIVTIIRKATIGI